MIYISRLLEKTIGKNTPPQAIAVLGARRVGKTTLLNEVAKGEKTLFFTGDQVTSVTRLQNCYEAGTLTDLLDKADTIIIDEVQRIPNAGLIIKILVDNNTKTRIFVTGSSAIDLAGGVRESAVGRIYREYLWPMALCEMPTKEAQKNLFSYLTFGMFPRVLTCKNPRKEITDYVDSILFKDIYASGIVRAPQKFRFLLQHLAASVGSEVNYDNLSRETGLTKEMLQRYLDLLEESYIIMRCPSWAKNSTNALKKGKKIYFCDVGVRNAILDDFRAFPQREDAGALWENFFFMERVKIHSYKETFTRLKFWRERKLGNSIGGEVDFLEMKDNQILRAFECKVQETKETKSMKVFRERFPACPVHVVTPANIFEHLDV